MSVSDNYFSSFLYGVYNENCVLTNLKYDSIIESEFGKIGLIKKSDSKGFYYDVYLNENFVCDADINSTENDILVLIKQNL